VQDACVQLNLTKPTGVYDIADEHATIMGSYANMIGPMMVDTEEWQQFDKPLSITGDGSQTDFPLPSDLSRIKNDTGWSHANRRPVIVVNEQQFAAIRAWVSQSFFINPACKIANDNLVFVTAPALNENITFEYVSKNWVIDGTTPSVLKERITTNSDTPMFDSVLFTIALRLKWLQVRGMPTAQAQQEFNIRLSQVLPRNIMAGVLSLNGGTYTGFRYLDGFYNSPDTGFSL